MSTLIRIKEVVEQVYDRYKIDKDIEAFKKYTDTIPSYLLFNKEMITKLEVYITTDAKKQDVIFSMLFDIITELSIDGLKLDTVRQNVHKDYNKSVWSNLIANSLYRLIKPKEKIEEDNLMWAIYLLKLI